MTRSRLRTGLALALALAALPGAAQEATLTPRELRGTAVEALRAGAPGRAYAYSEALIQRDPNDREAHLIRSRAARDIGEYDEAKRSAQAAWKLAETDGEKFAASMVMAQALSSNGQRTMSQLWLRRAVEHAPDEAMARRAIRDFKYVRARNPWATELSFAITPDSNINNGSSERSSFLNYQLSEVLYGQPVEYQLDGTALALSGIEYALGINTRYRFSETATRAHDVIFTADVRHYTLSSEAKAIAPNAEGNDFAFASYSLGYGHRGINFDRRGEYRMLVDLGQSWYGGDEYARFARLSLGQSYKLENGHRVNARIAGEHQIGVKTSDMDTVRADFSYTLPLPSGSVLWTNLTLATASSNVAADEFDEAGLRAQITFAKPLMGATAQLGLWARTRDYDVSPHSRDGREDNRVQADFNMIFTQVDYYGFNPTMRISASKTNSNISLFDAERFGINFGIQSAF
ncbi:surface lipoprotein assembly modifier [Lutimaribacter marinistellae]|uniref:Surface lipoprotein assembly modifier n=1 Tax=Lutimaribacter marinistellae TaxID=1820329 RepID=A0ABV7TLM8_9RHOB